MVVNYGQEAVVLYQGELIRCSTQRRVGFLVPGDKVYFEYQANTAVITKLLPRTTSLSRPDHREKLKPIAANISCMLIVSAPAPGVNRLLIDQYLVAADSIGCQGLIIFNKSDLWSEEEHKEIAQLCDLYRDNGTTCLCTSTHDLKSISKLHDALHHETAIMVGQSGVGKSSLIHALLPHYEIRVGELSAASGQGAHTTTATTLYPMGSFSAAEQSFLLDSPGVREFRVDYLTPKQIRQGFNDIHSLAIDCRFSDCQHRHEPQCAVRSAVEKAEIDTIRYDNYLNLLAEAEQRQKTWR